MSRSNKRTQKNVRNQFPNCVEDALLKINSFWGRPGKQQDLQAKLISNHIFGEIDERKKCKMTVAIQELQLIDVLSRFFRSSDKSPADLNALFLSLYPADNPRFKILGKLVSFAIFAKNKTLLSAAGIWMQQLGATSSQSAELAEHILDDYFVQTPKSVDKLKQLPALAPHFTANLLTAIGEIYKDSDPPMELLNLVGDWLSEDSGLLLTSLMDDPALPTGGIPMTPITPIAGLFRWCILSPLRVREENSEKWNEQKYYSKLQQLLMDSVLRLKTSSNFQHAICAQHFVNTARTLDTMLQTENLDEKARELSIERLAQAVSTAMSANCIYGNKQELLSLLKPLESQHFLIEWMLQNYIPKTT